MNNLTLFIILSFVVFRVTRFLMHDTLIEKQRMWVFIKISGKPKIHEDGTRYQPAWRMKVLELIQCAWCTSLHIGWMTVLVANQWTSIPLPWMYWVAIAGGAILIWDHVEGA